MLFSDDEPQTLSDLRGLTSYLKSQVERPEIVGVEEFLKLDEDERSEFNQRRMRYLSAGVTVRTPQMRRIVGQVERAIVENQSRNSGLGGLLISGESTMGKTTVAKAAMRRIFFMYTQAYPKYEREDRIPVVYVEVPPGATGKALIRRFATFLGLPLSGRDTMESLMDNVVNVLLAARTKLIVVDELHNLKQRTAGSGEAVDVLKSLSNRLPATFVYSGIALENSGLLAGDRGRQIRGRFISAPLRPFTLANDDEKGLWNGIIKQFEKDLCLFNHQPGELLKLSTYLHQRTGGSIGSLGRILTGTASWLIYQGVDPGEEKLTRELLDETRLDMTAEASYIRLSEKKSHKKKPSEPDSVEVQSNVA